MFTIESIKAFLTKGATGTNTGLLAVLALLTIQMYEMDGKLEQYHDESAYNYSEAMISREFAGIAGKQEVVAKVSFWLEAGWNAQNAALGTLCQQDGRKKLYTYITAETATTVCRMVN